MTKAIKILQDKKIAHTVHEYQHDPRAESYGLEAAAKMGVDAALVFKTLVIRTDTQEYCVCIIPVDRQLDLKKAAMAVGAKRAEMADGKDAERVTGYQLGGISPLGQKKRLRTLIDSTAENKAAVYVSAGRRGMDVGLSPQELCRLTGAGYADLAR